jgi:hypothetical protein
MAMPTTMRMDTAIRTVFSLEDFTTTFFGRGACTVAVPGTVTAVPHLGQLVFLPEYSPGTTTFFAHVGQKNLMG